MGYTVAKVIIIGASAPLNNDQLHALYANHGIRQVDKARHLLDFVSMRNGTAITCADLPAIYDRDAVIVPADSL